MTIKSKKPTKISFSSIDLQTLEFQFLVKRQDDLIQWLKLPSIITKEESRQIDNIIFKNKDLVEYFNEQELIIRHISYILDLVNFYGEGYNYFSERNISAIIDEREISGVVDFMVAGGKYTPTEPYFFIQEYKQQKNPSGDPLAQVLAEILVAQAVNGNEEVYGCYIIGKYWNFVSMKGRNYSVLASLDSTVKKDLESIILHLKSVKEYIEIEVKK